MESQGHGATPLTVTRGGSFAQHRFVHQLTEPMAMAMEEHPQEPPSGPPSGAYDSGYGYGAAPSGGAYGGAAPSGDYCRRLLRTCTEKQTSCDLGSSPENCPYGNYCVDMYVGCVGYGGSAPGVSPSGAPAPSMAMAPNGAPSGAPSPSSGYDYGAPGVSPSGAPSGAYGNVCLAQCYDQDLDPQGATYDGCVNTTVSGRTCQAWASTTPHNHGFTSLEENYCRNPDGEPGPWCYTTDSNKRWELCDAPICAAATTTTTTTAKDGDCRMEGNMAYIGNDVDHRTATG